MDSDEPKSKAAAPIGLALRGDEESGEAGAKAGEEDEEAEAADFMRNRREENSDQR
jgi:hypothetical protein